MGTGSANPVRIVRAANCSLVKAALDQRRVAARRTASNPPLHPHPGTFIRSLNARRTPAISGKLWRKVDQLPLPRHALEAKSSSTTTNSSAVPSPTLGAAPGSVPSLEDLYRMTSVPDERVVIHGVDWAFYEQLVDSIPEGANIHVDYDGKDLEIMSLSQLRRWNQETLGSFRGVDG